ncbi:reverse transcriptase domain-containing protein [Tanacetum coccineum]
MLLKKLPENLGDPCKFLIPCDFPGMDVCHALADLGASINLMPFSIWKKLSLPELTPTRMTLELADRSITRPKGVAEDVFVKVGKFYFPTDFVVVDFDVDPRVPLILGRSFLRTSRALINVYGEEITLWVNDEAINFNLNQTTRYSSTYDDMSVNRIDVIDVACEEYAQEVLGFSNNSTGGNPTPTSEPIIFDSSFSLTPFKGSDFILEEIEAYLKDDSISPEIDHADFDLEGDLRLIEELLNNDPSSPLPLSHNPLSSSTTSSSPSLTPIETSDALLEEFADELALLEPFPLGNCDDDFDSEGDILLLEKFLNDDDFTSSDDESSPDEDVPKDNVKIYSNPLFEFGDEYISSEPALLVTPLFNANEDECFDPRGVIDEIDAFLDMDISTDIENGYHDSEGDIIYLESLLIDDTIPNLPPKVKETNHYSSGVAYEGPLNPTNPFSKKVVEQETEETTDKEQTNFQGSTAHIQPPVIPIPILEPDVPKTLPKPNIPYPSRLNDQKLREKATNQMEKFFQIFQDLHFDNRFTDLLLVIAKNCL